ncbi:hypothetical protein V496_09391 [Pseudogymnoascus sp. VKM F-4515 (FW-2607)]|nr:hypothetical protein V496_09391 [Pseudogymnoascus sp. VKM F-4515 (FW-2607)]KFZ00378.1 hypothetical protein V498_00130 [Pseudogymnoascus sp. VKM F-4517 (FW-2822)]
MASAIQDVPDQEFNGIRYTGFPEPLSLDRNTTLPHPDADLSPDACIESFDPPSRSSSRFRFSSSRRVSSKGFIDPKKVYKNTLYVDSTTTVGAKPGSSSSKDSGSPGLGTDAEFKLRRRSSTDETDSSERQHQKQRGGLRGLFHRG